MSFNLNRSGATAAAQLNAAHTHANATALSAIDGTGYRNEVYYNSNLTYNASNNYALSNAGYTNATIGNAINTGVTLKDGATYQITIYYYSGQTATGTSTSGINEWIRPGILWANGNITSALDATSMPPWAIKSSVFTFRYQKVPMPSNPNIAVRQCLPPFGNFSSHTAMTTVAGQNVTYDSLTNQINGSSWSWAGWNQMSMGWNPPAGPTQIAALGDETLIIYGGTTDPTLNVTFGVKITEELSRNNY